MLCMKILIFMFVLCCIFVSLLSESLCVRMMCVVLSFCVSLIEEVLV